MKIIILVFFFSFSSYFFNHIFLSLFIFLIENSLSLSLFTCHGWNLSLHYNSIVEAHKLDEKTIFHGWRKRSAMDGLDVVLGLGLAEWPLKVFMCEARWWKWLHTYSRSAMDKPPQALSLMPTTSLVLRFSSPFSYCKALFHLFWVCFCFYFLERMWSCLILWVFFFCVCLFPKKNSGFMGLLEIGLVIVFMGLFLGFIFCFSGFDGDWVWLLDLDLGFARD